VGEQGAWSSGARAWLLWRRLALGCGGRSDAAAWEWWPATAGEEQGATARRQGWVVPELGRMVVNAGAWVSISSPRPVLDENPTEMAQICTKIDEFDGKNGGNSILALGTSDCGSKPQKTQQIRISNFELFFAVIF
jgi:hypothetical protein